MDNITALLHTARDEREKELINAAYWAGSLLERIVCDADAIREEAQYMPESEIEPDELAYIIGLSDEEIANTGREKLSESNIEERILNAFQYDIDVIRREAVFELLEKRTKRN